MSAVTEATLAGLLVFATAVWVGGFVAIAVVARVATRTLDAPGRVSLFRGLGRVYGGVGTAALGLALATGAALLYGRPWSPTLIATVTVAMLLVLALATGMAQARRMTRLRRSALRDPDDLALATRVRRGAVRAGILRAVIGGLTLALLALGVVLAG